MLGAERVRQVDPGPGPARPATAWPGEVSTVRHAHRRTSRDRAGIGYVPQRHTVVGADRAHRAGGRGVGRLPHSGWLGRLGTADRAVVAEAIDAVGLDGPGRADVSRALRRPAAARAHRPRARRRARRARHGRADRRRRPVSQQVLAARAGPPRRPRHPMVIVTHELGRARRHRHPHRAGHDGRIPPSTARRPTSPGSRAPRPRPRRTTTLRDPPPGHLAAPVARIEHPLDRSEDRHA